MCTAWRGRYAPCQVWQGSTLPAELPATKPYHWTEALWQLGEGYVHTDGKNLRYKVVAYDFGIKFNILRCLVSAGCDVTVVPATFPAEEALAMGPDGIFLSNGPGDPEPMVEVIENIRKFIGKKPIFGICLGHQLWDLRWADRPSSSSSATMAPTSRLWIWPPGRWKLPPRTTVSPLISFPFPTPRTGS